MLKAILIDDEPRAIRSLEKDLLMYCNEDVEVIDTCTSPMQGLKAITKLNPDVVFLDIRMPGMNGFELLSVLGEINFEVIFVTAYGEYALEAFDISAVHYIVKPVRKEKLIDAVQRLKEKRNIGITRQELKEIIENFNPTNPDKKLAIPSLHGYSFIPIKNIMYCIASGNQTFIHLEADKAPLINRNLGKLYSLLPKNQFFRIHASHLINRNYISEYYKGSGGYVQMDDGKSLNVASNRKKAFLDWLAI